MAIEFLRDGESTVICDDGHPNVLIATWIGPTTIKNVERFTVWSAARVAKAKAAGRLLVLINDALDAGRPGADVREAFARQPQVDNTVIASPVVLNNALVRGAMTAIGWLMGDRMKGVVAYGTMEEGFEAAREALAKHGVTIDKNAFAGYRRPTIPKSGTGG